jgi:flagellar L-ring protein precursor FlgH
MMERIETWRLTALIFLGLTGGCATQHVSMISDDYEYPEYSVPRTEGAIYQEGRGGTLFQDVRARHVGDTVTVVLMEKTNAAKSASTNTKKDNNIAIDNPTLFGNPVSFNLNPISGATRTLENNLSSSKKFGGEGDSAQSNELSGSITATVIKVLPNGYLKIRGEKQISINTGDEYIRITGIVRPVDIQSNNSISSTMVANAEISYGGKGVIADANDMGWLSKFFNSKWWPF